MSRFNFAQAIIRPDSAIYKEFTDFLARYVSSSLMESFVKVNETEVGRNPSDWSMWIRTMYISLKIYSEIIEYTRHSVDSQQPSELRYKRATNEFLCAIRECAEHQENSAASSHRRDIFATGICIRRPVVSRSRWRAPEGWNRKWGWLKCTFCRSCNLMAIGIRTS